jgi:hypothetical protein
MRSFFRTVPTPRAHFPKDGGARRFFDGDSATAFGLRVRLGSSFAASLNVVPARHVSFAGRGNGQNVSSEFCTPFIV